MERKKKREQKTYLLKIISGADEFCVIHAQYPCSITELSDFMSAQPKLQDVVGQTGEGPMDFGALPSSPHCVKAKGLQMCVIV